MGITLSNPDETTFVKDYPSFNTINLNKIDAYAGSSLITHPLTSYSPVLKGVTTDPVLGTGGFNRGYYYKIFDQVYVWGEIRFGTAGINAGSGLYSVSLPFNTSAFTGGSTSPPGRSHLVGNGTVLDDSAVVNIPFIVQLASNSTVQFDIRMNMGFGSVVVGSAVPVTWAINDGILWSARYTREGT